MADVTWNPVASMDEEALLAHGAPEHRGEQPRWNRTGTIKRAVIGVAGVASCLFVASRQAAHSDSEALPSKMLSSAFEVKTEITEAFHPEEAVQRQQQRKKLLLEGNLEEMFGELSLKHIRQSPPARIDILAACRPKARQLFKMIVAESGLTSELETSEAEAFSDRFASAMEQACKENRNTDRWLEKAGVELERQKPIMTEALAGSINAAGLGHRVQMRDWLRLESQATFQTRLGWKPSETDRPVARRGVLWDEAILPETFQAEDKWPACSEAIRRIHNQGNCGSCWAFSALAQLDARMCIASGGAFDDGRDVLSRMQVMSCGKEMKYPHESVDGCRGGLPQWAFEMMNTTGVVSSSCLPYYIGGEGVDHFKHRMTAPSCALENHCRGGYPNTIQQDAFQAPGVENYHWLEEVHGNEAKIRAMKMAIFTEGPVSFAFQVNGAFMGYASGIFSVCTPESYANHAVYASGWGELNGVPFVQASNSWGEEWGDDGRFLIHPNCVTDVVIAGTIHDVPLHDLPDVEPGVPDDPDNANWPWSGDAECPFWDGCLTDSEFDWPYVENELCVSSRLNGKVIEVVEFDTEAGSDVMYVNGRTFSGTKEDVAELDGLQVDSQGIKFVADAKDQRAGFKLCAK